jgi:hypothetical protein
LLESVWRSRFRSLLYNFPSLSIFKFGAKSAATFVATRLPFPDILRSEQKVALCAANKCFWKRRTSGFSTSGSHFRCFFSPKLFYALCLQRLRFSAIASRSSYKIAYEFEDDLIKSPQGSRDCREEPGISTQGDDDFVRTVSATAQMTTAWHDGDSDKRQHTRYRTKGTTMARATAGRG